MLQVAAGPIQAIHRSAAIATYRDARTWQWYDRLIHERQSGCSHLALPRSPRTRNGRVAGGNVQRKPNALPAPLAGFRPDRLQSHCSVLGPGCCVDSDGPRMIASTSHVRGNRALLARAAANPRRSAIDARAARSSATRGGALLVKSLGGMIAALVADAAPHPRPRRRKAARRRPSIAAPRWRVGVGAVCDPWIGPVLAIPGQSAQACPANSPRSAGNQSRAARRASAHDGGYAIKTPADHE